MSEQTQNLKLTGKDLINIGIFTAIYFVLSFIGMFLAIIPVLWIIMPGIIAILAGIPFMLLCAKVQKPGVPLLMGLITGLLDVYKRQIWHGQTRTDAGIVRNDRR